MPSITKEYRESLERTGKKYCHRCDEIFEPGDRLHEEHEQQREERFREAGLDPYP